LALNSLRSAVPGPIAELGAWVLDALGIRDRYVKGPHGFDVDKGLQVDVAVYFSDVPEKLYQLTQWLPVFENHPQDLKFGLVIRRYQAFLALQELTTLPMAHVPGFANLMSLFRVSSFKSVVYVNNGAGNFQALTVPELSHIHVNHGESDKLCMVSNQAKSYDRVFVAGEAAVQRHRAALSEFNENLLVRVGRPQLDEHPEPTIPESSRHTVLYAPTWEGEDEANNYTSMEKLGTKIIQAALAQANVRVLYKPHPRILDTQNQAIKSTHSAILKMMKSAISAQPSAGHQVQLNGDILALFPRVDLLITDVSSVGLDFLYLRPEKPMILTDRRNNIEKLRVDSPISVATPVLTKKNIDEAGAIIARELETDENEPNRHLLRKFYFDNVQAGQSTERFFNALREAISAHSADMERARALAATGTGPHLATRNTGN